MASKAGISCSRLRNRRAENPQSGCNPSPMLVGLRAGLAGSENGRQAGAPKVGGSIREGPTSMRGTGRESHFSQRVSLRFFAPASAARSALAQPEEPVGAGRGGARPSRPISAKGHPPPVVLLYPALGIVTLRLMDDQHLRDARTKNKATMSSSSRTGRAGRVEDHPCAGMAFWSAAISSTAPYASHDRERTANELFTSARAAARLESPRAVQRGPR